MIHLFLKILNLTKIIQSFTIYIINNDPDQIKSNVKSNIIINGQIELLDLNQEKNIIYSILVFEKALMLNGEDDLNQFISNNLDIPILSLQVTTKDSSFAEENEALNRKFCIKTATKTFKKIWSTIFRCITGYLIKKSYENAKINRILNQKQDFDIIAIERKDFVILRRLGNSYCSQVDLIYHLEKGELMALKYPNINNIEQPKLFEREKKNYSEINHCLLPKFYGTSEKEKYLVVEYINGQTLDHINDNIYFK